jgi:hypothetical protein
MSEIRFGIGMRVRTMKDAGAKDWATAARIGCAWGVTGTIRQISGSHGTTFLVNHDRKALIPHGGGFEVDAWYDSTEIELEVSTPYAILLKNLVLEWDPEKAAVVADACEACGNIGAARLLQGEVSRNVRFLIEMLAVCAGVKTISHGSISIWTTALPAVGDDWRLNWLPGYVPDQTRRNAFPIGATGPQGGVGGPVGATGPQGEMTYDEVRSQMDAIRSQMGGGPVGATGSIDSNWVGRDRDSWYR